MKVQEAIEQLNQLCVECGKYGSQQCVGCLIEESRQITILEAMRDQREAKVS